MFFFTKWKILGIVFSTTKLIGLSCAVQKSSNLERVFRGKITRLENCSSCDFQAISFLLEQTLDIVDRYVAYQFV